MKTFREYLKESNHPSNTKTSGEPSPEVSDPDGAIPLGDFNGSVEGGDGDDGDDGDDDTPHHHKRYEIHFVGSDSGKKCASDEIEAADMLEDILAKDPHAKVWVVDRMTGERFHPKED